MDSNKQGGGALVDSSCYAILPATSFGLTDMPSMIHIKKTGIYEISSCLNLYMSPQDHPDDVANVYPNGNANKVDLPHGAATPIIQVQAARLDAARTTRSEIHIATMIQLMVLGAVRSGARRTYVARQRFFQIGR